MTTTIGRIASFTLQVNAAATQAGAGVRSTFGKLIAGARSATQSTVSLLHVKSAVRRTSAIKCHILAVRNPLREIAKEAAVPRNASSLDHTNSAGFVEQSQHSLETFHSYEYDTAEIFYKTVMEEPHLNAQITEKAKNQMWFDDCYKVFLDGMSIQNEYDKENSNPSDIATKLSEFYRINKPYIKDNWDDAFTNFREALDKHGLLPEELGSTSGDSAKNSDDYKIIKKEELKKAIGALSDINQRFFETVKAQSNSVEYKPAKPSHEKPN